MFEHNTAVAAATTQEKEQQHLSQSHFFSVVALKFLPLFLSRKARCFISMCACVRVVCACVYACKHERVLSGRAFVAYGESNTHTTSLLCRALGVFFLLLCLIARVPVS